MKTRVKKLLVEALKSGEFKQGRDLMKYVAQDGTERHCILGVLTELFARAKSQRAGKFIEVPFQQIADDSAVDDLKSKRAQAGCSFLGSFHLPPDRVLEWAGMTEFEAEQLSYMNDNITSIATHVGSCKQGRATFKSFVRDFKEQLREEQLRDK